MEMILIPCYLKILTVHRVVTWFYYSVVSGLATPLIVMIMIVMLLLFAVRRERERER